MSEADVYAWMIRASLALAAVTMPVLFFIKAPYGRHAGESRWPTIDATVGWVVMESPSALVFLACFLLGEHRADPARLALLVLWELHYLNRSFVFPFRMRGGGRRMTLLVVVLSFLFTGTNGYLNGRWLFTFAPAEAYGAAWLADPRFVLGALLFVAGFAVNQQSDRILFELRKPGETGYKIPRGGLYRFVSCPNYLGEILEWSGFALASWSLAGLAFAVWTVANLLPRAVANHRWYREKFPDYPSERRALIPFVL